MPVPPKIDGVREEFEAAFMAGREPSIEDYLEQIPAGSRPTLLRELLLIEISRLKEGLPDLSSYLERFPDYQQDILKVIDEFRTMPSGTVEETLNFEADDATVTASLANTVANKQRDFFGDYELLEEIARGGMGIVYKAIQSKADRVVALKMIVSGQFASDEEVHRFYLEARAAAKLDHPGIVPVYDVGQQSGFHYFSMGLVEGCSLKDHLNNGPLGSVDAAELMVKICDAIAYAHSHRIIHRDLKPGNILMDQTGQPRVADFGLAKQLESSEDLTMTGQVIGTPAFMPPEQALGRAEAIDELSDVYSLGAILYNVLSGRVPFKGDSAIDILRKVADTDPLPLRRHDVAISSDLETICMKCLAKNKSERYESVASLRDDLRRFLEHKPISARPVGTFEKAWKWCRRKPMAAALIAASLLVVFLAGLGWSLSDQASSALRLVSLQRSFERELDEDEPSYAFLQKMDRYVESIAEIDSDAGLAAHQQVNTRFAESIEKALQSPRLMNADFERIEEALSLLESRSKERTQTIRNRLIQRRSKWNTVFDLQSPFSNLDTVFPESSLRHDNEAIFREQGKELSSEEILLSTVPTGRRVELSANLKDWREGDRISLVLNASTDSGYEFRLRHEVSERSADSETLQTERGMMVELLSNGELLRRNSVRLDSNQNTLSLRVQRDDTRLEFWINDSQVLEHTELFESDPSEQSYFALVLSESLRLIRLTAKQRDAPIVVSPLEEGDALFREHRYDLAAGKYETISSQNKDSVYQREAAYKRAICLLKLNRTSEATDLLEIVFSGQGSEWPPLAGCRLWVLRLAQNDFEKAELVFQSLVSRFTISDFVARLPRDTREEILGRYEILDANVDNLRVRREIEKYLYPNRAQYVTALQLFRELWEVGNTAEAMQIASAALEDPRFDDWAWKLYEEYCWIVRIEEDPKLASRILNRKLANKDGQLDPIAAAYLLVERARTNYSLSKVSTAKQDLRNLIDLLPADSQEGFRIIDAFLVLGLIQAKEGDRSGAIETWREGVTVVRRGGRGGATEFEKVLGIVRGGPHLVNYIIAATFSDTLRQSDVDGYADYLLEKAARRFPLASLLQNRTIRDSILSQEKVFSLVKGSWLSARGRRLADDFAMRTITFDEGFRNLQTLIATELIVQDAFAEGISNAELEIVEEFTIELIEALKRKKLPGTLAPAAIAAWKGEVGLIGWETVQRAIANEERLRFTAKYIFGNRYLHPDCMRERKAIQLLNELAKEVPSGVPLHSLARLRLEEHGRDRIAAEWVLSRRGASASTYWFGW